MSFTFWNIYGNYEDCDFQVKRYVGTDNLCVEIWNPEDGCIIRATVNTEHKLPDDRIAIKNYSENAGMVKWLYANDIIEEHPVQILDINFVEIPVHRLTEFGKTALRLV